MFFAVVGATEFFSEHLVSPKKQNGEHKPKKSLF